LDIAGPGCCWKEMKMNYRKLYRLYNGEKLTVKRRLGHGTPVLETVAAQ